MTDNRIEEIIDKRFIPPLRKHMEVEPADSGEYEGYYCLAIDPTVCSCGHLQEYFEPLDVHAVLVWQQIDDRCLLAVAAKAMEIGNDAHVVKFKPEFGSPIEFYYAFKIGLIR